MYREEEIAKGSDDEKRVSNTGGVLIKAEGIEHSIKETAHSEERKMLFHILCVNCLRLIHWL